MSLSRNKKFRVFNILFCCSGVPLYYVPKSFMYTIFAIIAIFSCYSTGFALVMNVYIHLNDLDKAADTMIALPPIVTIFWIQIYIRFRRNNIVKLLYLADCFTWEDLPPKDNVTGNTSMAVWIRRVKTITLGVTIIGLSAHYTQSLLRITMNEERLLSLDGWYPYDWKKSPAYEITSIIQIIAALGIGSTLYAFPTFYATLVLIACSQLEKIREKLSNIKQNHTLSTGVEGGDENLEFQRSEETFAHMQGQLKKCIRLHQETIRFTKELEENFSTLFVGIFLILMTALCLAALTAVMGERVRDIAWACDWVGAPLSFQRRLLFVIACANKELIMTAGKCVPVNKQTMLNMIQESISLFMFLLQVRSGDE